MWLSAYICVCQLFQANLTVLCIYAVKEISCLTNKEKLYSNTNKNTNYNLKYYKNDYMNFSTLLRWIGFYSYIGNQYFLNKSNKPSDVSFIRWYLFWICNNSNLFSSLNRSYSNEFVFLFLFMVYENKWLIERL